MENITSKGTIFGTMIAQAGPKGDTGKTGERGLTGENGYSPIKGVDYFTQEDILEIRKDIEGDLTGEYNKNAMEKINIFNTTAKETTTSFNLNAENKIKEYNDNALAEIEKYNSNVIEKSTNFDTNFENKTSKFDSNYDEKIKDFDDNAAVKLDAYNKNDTNKTNDYNVNDKAKTDAYNNNTVLKEKAYNDNATSKTAEFNENAANKLSEYTQNAEELINKVEQVQAENESLKAENRIIKEQIPGAAASGNSIHLEDSSNLEMNWKIKDGHRQETREGYNLLDTSNVEEKEYDGIRVTRNSDGSIKFKGTATKDFAFTYSFEKVLNGTYQESMQVIGTINDSTGFISSTIWNGGTNLFGDLMLKSNSTQILNKTFAENTNITHAMFYVATGAVLDCTIYPLLYKFDGTTKPYEQYGASPSPSFPSKIETVVGNNINEFDEELELGSIGNNDGKNYGTAKNTRSKNYLAVEENTTYALSDNINGSFIVHAYDKDKNWLKMIGASNYTGKYIFTTPQQTAYIRFRTNETDLTAKIKLEKGSIVTPYSPFGMGSVEIDVVNKNFINKNKISKGLTITATGEMTNSKYFSTDYIKVSKNETYYANEYVPVVAAYDKDKKSIGYIRNTLTGGSFNTGNAVYIRARNNVQLSTEEEIQNAIDKAMIIKGSTSSDYIEHQSQTAIMPIQQEMLEGDYVTDVEHHEWKKLLLTGNENWTKGYNDGSERENVGFMVELEELKQIDKTQNFVLCGALCNYLKESLFWANDISKEVWGNLNTFALSMSAQYRLALNIGNINTVEELKSFLNSKYEAGTPITIYYKLATPVDLELTLEQKAVREQKLYTYKNITNISVSDELASIDVEYKKDQDTINKNYENRLAALETVKTNTNEEA